jgi:16S rRNA (cytosine1402-N4)-methyltransferase
LDVAHVPVLVAEVVDYLAPRRGGLFVDATVGPGGHAEALLAASPAVRLVGVDRDPEALALAGRRLAPYGERVRLVEGRFDALAALLAPLGLGPVAGVLADLGVSSLQLDTPRRGFSFRREGPLDMRMGREGPTAAEVVNRYPEGDLERIFREYGEERQARRIARAIARARREGPIATTGDLAALIRRAKGRTGAGPAQREGRVDPATRVFQALRIEVNQELAALPGLIAETVELLEQDGRLVVISYQSLEDRLVKNVLRDLARGAVDEVTGQTRWETQVIEVLTKKPVRPTSEEVAANPRARSARLRAARRL